MNTTPDFEDIGRTVPLETTRQIRTFAALRLGVVAIAVCLCLKQLLQLDLWSGIVDRGLILLGLWCGLGMYADSIEFVWRKLGVFGRIATYALGLIILLGTLTAQGNQIWTDVAMIFVMSLLGAMTFGLMRTLLSPARTQRFRQMKRYLRTQPRAQRHRMRDRLDKGFQTLIAEGFH